MMDEAYPPEDDAVDARYDEAMALNAKLKAMLESGQVDPEIAAQALGLGNSAPREPLYEHTNRPAPQRSTRRRRAPAPAAAAAAADQGAAGDGRNFTFGGERLNDIGKSNLRLMHSLMRINSGTGVMRTRERRVKIRSSAAINRQRKSKKIMNENAAFLKRLQSVKASSSLSRTKMKQEAIKQKKLAKQMQTVGVRRKKRRKKKPDLMESRATGDGFAF